MTTEIYPNWQTAIRSAQLADQLEQNRIRSEELEKFRQENMRLAAGLGKVLTALLGTEITSEYPSIKFENVEFEIETFNEDDKGNVYFKLNIIYVPDDLDPEDYPMHQLKPGWLRWEQDWTHLRVSVANSIDSLKSAYQYQLKAAEIAAANRDARKAVDLNAVYPGYNWIVGLVYRMEHGGELDTADNLVLALVEWMSEMNIDRPAEESWEG